MNSAKMALRFLRREWRSGELLTLAASLVLAVTAVLTVSLITDRMTAAMARESAELVGGDVVISSTREPDPAWLELARQLELENTQVLLFDSVLFAGDEMQLASVKAVSDGYPLVGRLQTRTSLEGETRETTDIPAPGTAWADPRLLDLLGVRPGDRVTLGARELRLEQLVVFEPDQAGSLFQFAPRLLVNRQDLAAAGVLGPGSRIRYRTMVKGIGAEEFRDRLEPGLGTGHRIFTPDEEDNRASEALSRATQYIRLATLLTLVLAAIAIALTARRYAERHRNTSAMLRCLGGQRRSISQLFTIQLLLLTICTLALAAVAGWILHEAILGILAPLLPVALPAPTAGPWIVACASALLLVTGFALPPLLRLSNTPPLRVLRQDLDPPSLSTWLGYGLTIGSQLILLLVLFDDIGEILLYIMLATVAVVLTGWLIYRGLRGLKQRIGGRRALLARSLRNLAAHPMTTTSQIMAFSLTLLMMLMLTHLRTDLLTEWRLQLPDNAPNHFAFNLFPEETEAFINTVSPVAELQPLYPVVRGRLVAINGDRQPVIGGGDNRRELNFTWTADRPEDNEISAGRWPPEPGEVSVEEGYAQRLGIDVGDTVEVDIGDVRFQVRVSSLRSLEWESFTPNFFLIFNREQLEDKPATYLTSFYLDGDNRQLLRELNRKFPSLTIIEVDNIIARMEVILAQVSLSVEVVLLFVLLGGFAVLFATLQTTADERLREGALLRALGASRNYVKRAYLTEFGLIGLISGAIAVAGAEIFTAILYRQAFNLAFSPSPLLWLAVPAAMGAVVALAGYWGSRRVLRVSPNRLLVNE